MTFYMFCKIFLIYVSLAALFALEWSLPRVRPHVSLQITRSSASVVALVTFEWLFFGVLSHHMNFQLIICNAGIFAYIVSLDSRLNTGVAQATFERFFSDVFPDHEILNHDL